MPGAESPIIKRCWGFSELCENTEVAIRHQKSAALKIFDMGRLPSQM
jgi:hypothetical protein